MEFVSEMKIKGRNMHNTDVQTKKMASNSESASLQKENDWSNGFDICIERDDEHIHNQEIFENVLIPKKDIGNVSSSTDNPNNEGSDGNFNTLKGADFDAAEQIESVSKDASDSEVEDLELISLSENIESESSRHSGSLELSVDIQESNETICSSSRERTKVSLPYFQLPKPDLKEFLMEKINKSLHDYKNKRDRGKASLPKSDIQELLMEKMDKAMHDCKNRYETQLLTEKKGSMVAGKSHELFIKFDDDDEPVTPIEKFRNKFINHTKCKPLMDCTSSERESSKSLNDFEERENESPGSKRIALKEFLKKQIDEKKLAAFNKSREILKLEEEDLESDCESILVSEDSEIEEVEEPDEIKILEPVHNLSEDSLPHEDRHFKENNYEKKLDFSDGDCSKIVSLEEREGLLGEMRDESSSESEDELVLMKKSKRVAKLEESDDESKDSSIISQSHGFSEKQSSECVVRKPIDGECVSEFLQKCNSPMPKQIFESDDNLKLDLLKASVDSSLSEVEKDVVLSDVDPSLVPPYEPYEYSDESIASENTDFICKVLREESQSIISRKIEKGSAASCSQNIPVIDNLFSSDNKPALGIKLDDLPIFSESNLFATQDLDDLCSGNFKKDDSQKTENSKDADACSATGEKIEDFFDDEAELSGDDDGCDDLEYDDDNSVHDMIDDDEEAIDDKKDEVAGLFMKRMVDDDEVLVNEIKERFLDDGELNSDGAGRLRRFAWKNDDADNMNYENTSESDSEERDQEDESYNVMCRERLQWQQENKEKQSEVFSSSECVKKPKLKMKVVGRGKTDDLLDLYYFNKHTHTEKQDEEEKNFSLKRPRGSFLNLDDGSASRVLKKLKVTEDNSDGSRTTKHFVFRNDLLECATLEKDYSRIDAGSKMLNDSFCHTALEVDDPNAVTNQSVFDCI